MSDRMDDAFHDRFFASLPASLARPARIRFGRGAANTVAQELGRVAPGAPVLLVCAGHTIANGLAGQILGRIREAGHAAQIHRLPGGEPTLDSVAGAADAARTLAPGAVIGLGGGSALDTAKAAAALAVNEGGAEPYLEGAGHGRRMACDPLPCIALPTTAGTGAEMTRNAVVSVPRLGAKKSLRDERLVPAAALVDPALARGAPPATIAAAGLDAMTQLIEACISARRRPETTRLAHRALAGLPGALLRFHADPEDLDAAEACAFASACSGICLANAGLAMAHGIAAALGALHGMPHGRACGLLLPHTLAWNRDACAGELADAFTALFGDCGEDGDPVGCGIRRIAHLVRDLGLPAGLAALRLDEGAIERLAAASMGNSMAGNPVPMDPESTARFLRTIAG